MFFTSSLLFFTCSWMMSDCTAEDVYALANKEAKLYFDYNLPFKKADINQGGDLLAFIEKTSAEVKLNVAGKDGIGVKYIDTTNQVMVTIENVSSRYNGNITMYNQTSGNLLKQWHVHVLDCTAKDVYAHANKEAKLCFDFNLPWNKALIDKGGVLLASIEKTSANVKLRFAGIDGIGVKYIDTTNQGMVTIRHVSSRYNGNITMYDATSGNLLKQWHVHVLENPIIRESSPPWAGQDYQLNCAGDSFGVTKYKWYKGDHLLTPDRKYSVTGNKLKIRNIQPEDSTKLTCVVGITDEIQSNNSDIFSVDVLYGPDNIKITSEPPDFAIEDGKSITLKCDATCHPPCHFQWSDLVNAKGSSLEVQYMTSNQNGPYTCTATNPKSATKNKSETVYLNSGKQVTETFKTTESSRDCTAEDVYALANKEAKLYFGYNLPWNKALIDKGGVLLVSIEKTSANVKLRFAGIDGIGVKYIDTTNQGMVTIGNVSSRYNGNLTMYDATSGNLLKQWHVHVLDCTAKDVYAHANKEAKLCFDFNLPWNKALIDKGGVLLASIEKTSANVKLRFAGIDGIGVKYIDTTNQGMVTIRHVSSRYNGNITMYDATSGNLLKQWHVHVLDL